MAQQYSYAAPRYEFNECSTLLKEAISKLQFTLQTTVEVGRLEMAIKLSPEAVSVLLSDQLAEVLKKQKQQMQELQEYLRVLERRSN